MAPVIRHFCNSALSRLHLATLRNSAPVYQSSLTSLRKYRTVLNTSSPTQINIPVTNVSCLPNGLRVASENSGIPTCTVGVWIDAGSRYENDKNNGVAHFLEHMAFKGTQQRSQTELELEVENMGAHLNAYTSREQTVYYAKCLSVDLERAVEILSDILLRSKFGKPEVERERGVIMREMQEVEQNLQEVVFDHLHSVSFEGTPLARTILGPEENIRSIQRQDLIDYIAVHYKAPRMVIAGAGGIDHNHLVELANKYFGHVPSENPCDLPVIEKCQFHGADFRHRDDDMPFVYGALALEGASWTNADNIPLMIANTLIGQWDRTHALGAGPPSRFAQIVSQAGKCQSFQAFNTCYKDTGLWGLYFVSEGDKPSSFDIFARIQEEWDYFCNNVTDDEVERGKNMLKTSMLLMLDGSTPICEDIGRQMLCYGRRIPVPELELRIDAVDAKHVRKVCSKYVNGTPRCAASVGLTNALSEFVTN